MTKSALAPENVETRFIASVSQFIACGVGTRFITSVCKNGTTVYFSDLGSIALILVLGFALYTVVIAVLGAVRAQPHLAIRGQRSLLDVTFFLRLDAARRVVPFLTNVFGVDK